MSRNVVILGSTGSIGRNTLDVVRASRGRLAAIGLLANTSVDLLCRQAAEFQPRWIHAAGGQVSAYSLPPRVGLLEGADAVQQLVSASEVDVVVAAIVGSAGLEGAWAALEAGKTLALANKETMVVAGPLVGRLAEQRGARILPVDSEHSAIFQALQSGRSEEVRRVILTASGGPFREFTGDQLSQVTVEQALAHPTWDMGRKITIESETMMNKAREIAEARWLFDLQPDQIDVVVHPQSIVHSLVEFVDGSVLAQLSPPDMRLPIQYALTYPERWPCPAPQLDFASTLDLQFLPPDLDRFPALELGFEVARRGGTTGAVLNAANEAAVAGFLQGQLGFTDIVPACRSVLDHHEFDPHPTLTELMRLDAWAREEVSRWVCA